MEKLTNIAKLDPVAGFKSIFKTTLFYNRYEGRLKEAFARVDQDGDGKITLSDLRAYVEQTFEGSPLDESLLETIFNAAGADSDGNLSLQQFNAVAQVLPNP